MGALSALCGKPIADRWFGENQFRSGRIGFELFAEVGDVDPEVL